MCSLRGLRKVGRAAESYASRELRQGENVIGWLLRGLDRAAQFVGMYCSLRVWEERTERTNSCNSGT